MFRGLIVPLDGSTFAEHALPYAASIARRAGAMLQIILVHVPLASRYSGSELVADLTLDSTIRENETAYLDRVVKRLTEIVPVHINRTLLDSPIAGSNSRIRRDRRRGSGCDGHPRARLNESVLAGQRCR